MAISGMDTQHYALVHDGGKIIKQELWESSGQNDPSVGTAPFFWKVEVGFHFDSYNSKCHHVGQAPEHAQDVVLKI